MEYDDHDLCSMEALDILRPASDCLLQMAASGQIDLNALARMEFHARCAPPATRDICPRCNNS